jgi:hypothetical protein
MVDPVKPDPIAGLSHGRRKWVDRIVGMGNTMQDGSIPGDRGHG